MRLDIDTHTIAGVSDAVRRAAVQLRAVDLPRPPPCEDVGASDAIAALLAVSGESLAVLSHAIDTVGVLVETARADYARAEASAAAAVAR